MGESSRGECSLIRAVIIIRYKLKKTNALTLRQSTACWETLEAAELVSSEKILQVSSHKSSTSSGFPRRMHLTDCTCGGCVLVTEVSARCSMRGEPRSSLVSRGLVGENMNGGGIGNDTKSSVDEIAFAAARSWEGDSFTGVRGTVVDAEEGS